jgi:hypothetical protein
MISSTTQIAQHGLVVQCITISIITITISISFTIITSNTARIKRIINTPTPLPHLCGFQKIHIYPHISRPPDSREHEGLARHLHLHAAGHVTHDLQRSRRF